MWYSRCSTSPSRYASSITGSSPAAPTTVRSRQARRARRRCAAPRHSGTVPIAGRRLDSAAAAATAVGRAAAAIIEGVWRLCGVRSWRARRRQVPAGQRAHGGAAEAVDGLAVEGRELGRVREQPRLD